MTEAAAVGAPAAKARLKRGWQANFWVVDKCPLCGLTHTHGAGIHGDDPRRFLGHRAANCSIRTTNSGYVLVADDNEP